MKNSVNKGMLFYLFVFIGIAVGACCIVLAILMLSPNTSIFGYKYCHCNESVTLNRVMEENSSTADLHNLINNGKIETIFITNNYGNVNLVTDTNKYYKVTCEINTTGFMKKENSREMAVEPVYDIDSKSYSISVKEPDLALTFSKTANITICLPEPADCPNVSNLSYNIKTNTGGVNFGKNSFLGTTINNLSITATKSSTVSLYSNINITGDVCYDCPAGAFYMHTTNSQSTTKKQYKYDNFSINSLNIKTQSAKINCGKVIVNKSTTYNTKIRTTESNINFDELVSNVDFISQKGLIKLTNLTGNLRCSENIEYTNIYIVNLQGSILMSKSKASNITIEKLETGAERSLIETQSGDVKILDNTSNLTIITTSGNVSVVNNSTGIVDITTDSGDITTDFNNIVSNKNTITTASGTILFDVNKTLDFNLLYKTAKQPTFSTDLAEIESIESTNDFMYKQVGSHTSTAYVYISNTSGKTTCNNYIEL